MSELQHRAGGVGKTAGDVFGQATEGVREGAGKIGQATGLEDIIGQLAGRSIAVNAAKIGALALIGGLAYKSYQNYSEGRPLINSGEAPAAAPDGSGFEEASVSN
ncbi:MAG: DUF533 domain-containing protein, partial [Hyphomicrobiaceae bacterium]